MSRRQSYRGVVAAAPITIPYERFSIHGAHWWIGRALRALSQQAQLKPADIDGFSVSSFTVGPDTAIGLTQHFGLSPRFLDHVPLGGHLRVEFGTDAIGPPTATCPRADDHQPVPFELFAKGRVIP